MYRYFLRIAYNGKNYHGWQLQLNAITVQQLIDDALKTLTGKAIETTGCGRTDTGVHAATFFLHFDLEEEIVDRDNFVHKLNAISPRDISVYEIYAVNESAHARFDATSRTYKYYIHQDTNPFVNEFSYYFPRMLNIDLILKACKLIESKHDFASFCKVGGQQFTTLCKIQSAKWSKIDNEFAQCRQFVFEITADRFLRNMVRALVGTLLDIGIEKISIEDLENIFSKQDRSYAGSSVPAHGLFLTDVKYPYIKFPYEKGSLHE